MSFQPFYRYFLKSFSEDNNFHIYQATNHFEQKKKWGRRDLSS